MGIQPNEPEEPTGRGGSLKDPVVLRFPLEWPNTPKIKWAFKHYLQSLAPELPVLGKDGRSVGIGFEWQTRTGAEEKGISHLVPIVRFLQRALMAEGILSQQAATYLLKCKATYIRDGEGSVVLTLKED